MKGYSLKQLLLFFKRQQYIGFQGINLLIAIIEDDEYTDAEKRDAILDLLGRMELYDEESIDRRILRLEHEIRMKEFDDIVWDIPGMGPVNPTQVFGCVFLNGEVQFEWNLN